MPEQSLADWLRSLPNVIDARPCTVAIEGTTYEAARYQVAVVAPAGSRAALEHRSPSIEDRFYVLGVPAHEHHRTAYTLAGDEHEWFIGGWAPARVANSATYSKFHPYGPWFQLHAWTADGAIDADEDRPYRRLTMEVHYGRAH